ncbi:MAG TPA: PVC-type heme-binding CxxCH protein, partial [Planctomycetaceae bacterium]|nr:PVC-type heme-binding CxxCH protein [Planctomycetaceae bacterium]
GLDNGGTDQNAGRSTSVEFLVFTEVPPGRFLRAAQGNAPAAGNLKPDEALDALDVHPELEVTLFAAEPLLLSPSNIDIDHLGRVWVCEIVNYRHFANKDNPPREEGDRILILEDRDGDGRAETRTVFYQGRDIDSPHGVCVLPAEKGVRPSAGTRAIVSAGESVVILTDEDGDGRADRKDVLFTGIGGVQHDHGIHAFVFGPDGRFYFNFGNSGKQIKDKHGRPIVDLAGNEVNDRRQPYQEGMVFRCDIVRDADGGFTHKNFETLGWNFRNNWEVAVDSFGTLWQSDNDDDGNRGVRINYVMEFGNYGYKDELTGAGWQQPRTNMESEIPLRHWHLNDPGVVPNLLQTGAGSPTGILVYEGDLLPEVFRGQIIHCDAGPNVVRAYPVEPDGAGYKASVVNILEGARDQWFRPSDVCVAPDGSLIVADWYDPGVGGHRMGDLNQGRLYRVAPPKTKYSVPKYEFSTAEGAVEALRSPNLAVRYMAWTALHAMQDKAQPALHKLLHNGKDLRHRARALWLLSRIKGRGYEYAARVLDHPQEDLVIVALRAIVRMVPEMREFVSGDAQRAFDEVGAEGLLARCVESRSQDESGYVRRECLIALRHSRVAHMPRLWADLAMEYVADQSKQDAGADTSRAAGAASVEAPSALGSAQDRWYLEALGIAADRQWADCFDTWLRDVGERWNTPAGRDIVWRSRAEAALPLLAKIILDPQTPAGELPRYFRALDFHPSGDQAGTKQSVLLELALKAEGPNAGTIAELALKHVGRTDLRRSPELQAAVEQALNAAPGTARFVQLVERFNVFGRDADLLAIAQRHPDEQLGVEAIRLLLARSQLPLLTQALSDPEPELALATVRVLGNSLDAAAVKPLSRLFHDHQASAELRREAARALARTGNGTALLIRLAESDALDAVVKEAVAAALQASPQPAAREAAAKFFPLPPTKDNQPLPPIEELVKRTGDPVQGRVLFNTTATCVKCHQVDGLGKDVGPDLTEIGTKLSRHALYESILYPSAGISHNYETYTLALDSGNTVTGILTSRTDEEVSIKGEDAIVRTFKAGEIDEIVKQNVSLMPADIQKTMTLDELVHVIEYMASLRKAAEQTKAAP